MPIATRVSRPKRIADSKDRATRGPSTAALTADSAELALYSRAVNGGLTGAAQPLRRVALASKVAADTHIPIA
jgi:hypothetical protein